MGKQTGGAWVIPLSLIENKKIYVVIRHFLPLRNGKKLRMSGKIQILDKI